MFIHFALMAVLFTGPSIPDVVAAKAVTTVVAPEATEQTAGARFAAEVGHRLAQGWHLAGVDVLDDGTELTLELVLAREQRAERIALVFDGEGRTTLAYVRARAKLPDERRVYRFAAELQTVLAGGAVDSLFAECGSYFLEGAGGGVSVDPYDYYVVTSRARGARAHRIFANAIAGAIEDDMRLAGVIPTAGQSTGLPVTPASPAQRASADGSRSTPPPPSAPAAAGAIDVVLFKGHEEVVHAELDRDGRITAVEVRWSPVAYASWARTYTGDAELARALRAARTVEALAFDEGAAGTEPRLVLRLAGDRELVVDTADFVVDEDDLEDFRCPC